MRLKDNSINVNGLKPEMMVLFAILLTVERIFGIEFTITSISDYKHGKNSNHYKGFAIDLRSKDIPEDIKTKVFAAIKDRINSEFRIIFENEGEDNEHWHLDYHPRYQSN